MIHFPYLVLIFSILFTPKISGLHLGKILSQDSIRSIIVQQEKITPIVEEELVEPIMEDELKHTTTHS